MREYIFAPAEVMSRTLQPLFILFGSGYLSSPRAVVGQYWVALSWPQPKSSGTHPTGKQSGRRVSGDGFGKSRRILCQKERWGVVAVVVAHFRRQGGTANILVGGILEMRHNEILYSPNNFPSSFSVLLCVFNWQYCKYPDGLKIRVGRTTIATEIE